MYVCMHACMHVCVCVCVRARYTGDLSWLYTRFSEGQGSEGSGGKEIPLGTLCKSSEE